MSRISDIEEEYVNKIDSETISVEVASEHYIKAYKRGLSEGRRQSLAVVQDAKNELKKKASSMPGPVWHTAMQWLTVIESKI